MAKYFSASRPGFYDDRIHGTKLPDDAVEVSDADWQALLDQQSHGKSIIADANGNPIATDEPQPLRLNVKVPK